MYNVQVKQKEGENSTGLLRRFSRSILTASIASRAKKSLYFERCPSKTTKKKDCLLRIKKKGAYEEKYRMGKVTENSFRRGRRS